MALLRYCFAETRNLALSCLENPVLLLHEGRNFIKTLFSSDTKREADKRVKSLEREAEAEAQRSEKASKPAPGDTGDTQATPSLLGETVSTSSPVSTSPQGQTASIPQSPGETYLEPSAKSKEVKCDICELD